MTNSGETGRNSMRTLERRPADNLKRRTKLKLAVFLLALPLSIPVQVSQAQRSPWQVVPVSIRVRPISATESINKWAAYYKVDKYLAIRIAHAESGLNCKVQNENSSAGGLFQFVNSTFVSTQKRLGKRPDISKKLDCDENAELGIYLLSKGELYHWSASRTAWDQTTVREQ